MLQGHYVAGNDLELLMLLLFLQKAPSTGLKQYTVLPVLSVYFGPEED